MFKNNGDDWEWQWELRGLTLYIYACICIHFPLFVKPLKAQYRTVPEWVKNDVKGHGGNENTGLN